MSIQQTYQINGLLDTSKPVLENLEILTSSCNCFFTFDVHSGKWAIIANQIGASVKSFNDSNIVGSILLSTTGMTDYYNQVQINFPHKDILDQIDTVIETVPKSDWLPNEQSKVLTLSFDTINDPVQAQLLGAVQLKQSRVDQIIKFNTDYTSLGLQAGDLIDVTNSVYGYTNKIFRIINIQEADDTNGSLTISITALEYKSAVYDTTTLTRQIRTPVNGIIQKNANSAITSTAGDALGGLGMALGATTLLSLLDKFLSGSTESGGIFSTIMDLFKAATGVDILGFFKNLGSSILSALGLGSLSDLMGTDDEVWNTVVSESTTETIDVEGVGIRRFTTITFTKPNGKKVKMNITWP